MKTTVEIADALLWQAKDLARQENRTLRSLVEDGLRKVLAERQNAKPFRYRPHPFQGKGLQPGIREGDWEQIRELIYGL